MIMELSHRYVFTADKLIMRCRLIEDRHVPSELVDMTDLLDQLKSLLLVSTQDQPVRQRCSSDPGARKSSFLLSLRRRRNSPDSFPSTPTIFKRQTSEPTTNSDAMDDNAVILQMSPAMRLREEDKLQLRNERQKNNNNNRNPELKKQVMIKKRRDSILQCLDEKPSEYVHICTFDKLDATEAFLQRLVSAKTTFSIEIDVNDGSDCISISYQQLNDFNCEYMVLNCNMKGCLMLMRPF